MTESIRVDRNVAMTTRDRVILRADVYRPDGGGRYPAVLVRTPYNKQLGGVNDMFRSVDLAFRDYAVVIQDLRGRFASDGVYGERNAEGTDGYDTVEWVASQPWCDGKVGMAGGSYVASTQWQAAMTQPPSLRAIAPAIISTGTRQGFFTGGAFHFDHVLSWILAMAVDVVAKLRMRGEATPETEQAVARAIQDIETLYLHLPLKGLAKLFPGLPPNLFAMLDNPSPDAPAWLLAAGEWSWDKVQTPALHIGGWYDLFTQWTFANWQGLRSKGGSARAREGQHVLMGPWYHGAALPNMVGGLNFGAEAGGPAGLVNDYHARFYDRYLKGLDVSLPPVRYFVMGENRWHDAEDWPLLGTDWQRFYLRGRGRANSLSGDGRLSREEPGQEAPDLFIYDPQFPVPTTGGRNLGAGRLVSGPFDQSNVERRHDVLIYSTEPLAEDLEVTGPLVLHLFAATSARDTDFVAKLTDVYPDGRSMNVAEGIIRARFWKSSSQADLVQPGEVREYVIDLAATSNLFHRGHRIRLDVTSSNFPRYDRNMNTGNPIGSDAEGMPATQTILHEAGRASYVDLPVIPAR